MADPRLWQILEAFQAALAGIVGDGGLTYWHTPGAVYITRTWAPEEDSRLWNTSIDGGVIYGVRRTDRRIAESSTGDNISGGNLRAEVDVHILVSRVLSNSSPADEPSAAEIVEQMMADVYRKLFFEGVATLGGLVDNIADPGAEDTNQVFLDGWAAGEITFHVAYTFSASAP